MIVTADPKQWMWEQKYRPQSIEECILPKTDKEFFNAFVRERKIPNLLLVSNASGTGKTSVARALASDCEYEVLFLNTADVNINVMRNEIRNFASSGSFKNRPKVVILDEFDRAPIDLQKAFRSFIEEFSSTCTFILTANYIGSILPALKSRFRLFEFGKPSDEEEKRHMMKLMANRCIKICEMEGVEVEEPKAIGRLIMRDFPDFRSVLKQLNSYATLRNSIDIGVLEKVDTSSNIDPLIDALKNKNFKTLRGMAIQYSQDYPSFIKKLYNELFMHVEPLTLPMMIEQIGKNQETYQNVADLDIHIQYLFVQLMMTMEWKR